MELHEFKAPPWRLSSSTNVVCIPGGKKVPGMLYFDREDACLVALSTFLRLRGAGDAELVEAGFGHAEILAYDGRWSAWRLALRPPEQMRHKGKFVGGTTMNYDILIVGPDTCVTWSEFCESFSE